MNPYAAQDRIAREAEDEAEAFENWCALGNHDPDAVGTWERFEAEQAEAQQAYWEGVAEDRASDW